MTNRIDVNYLAHVRPSARQLAWQKMEMYAFLHFGMNTFTNREWGLGHEDPHLFRLENLDVEEWMQALCAAGMTGVILTCKHHDGFCLWPSHVTEHSIASTDYQHGNGDIVKEVSEAARKYGLKFGVYLSPWDRTESSYGTGKEYDDFYVAQLTELLTGYGEIFCVWLDGANGEGANGKTQFYDWPRYYNVIRSLQPNAVISVCGPDVRWAGNEAGHVRKNEWSVVPVQLRSAELTAEKSQHEDDGTFATQVRSQEEDLGSTEALEPFGDQVCWYPAEVDTSIRPGWFYHSSEDDAVKSAESLFDLWKQAVGGNCTLLLNIPPMPNGHLAQPDRLALQGLGQKIRDFNSQLITDVSYSASSGSPQGLGSGQSVWRAQGASEGAWVRMSFEKPQRISSVVLEENIEQGQRIEQCEVSITQPDGATAIVGQCGCVGYRRIIEFPACTALSVTLRIVHSRANPELTRFQAGSAE